MKFRRRAPFDWVFLVNLRLLLAEAAQLRAHPRWLKQGFTTHLMLSARPPQSAERMRAFNQGLRILQRPHEYADLLRLPGCTLHPQGR